MAQNSPKNFPSTSDEEDSSGDDERFGGRRRRFCIERKQQLEPKPSPIKSKRIRTEQIQNRRRIDDTRITAKKRKISSQARNQVIPIAVKPKSEQPIGPVIFINPKFVKKFIEKSIKLSSSTSKTINPSTSTKNISDNFNASKASSTTTTGTSSMIEEIDFKTSSKESLQAASTMAIIRLVTECIEDDSKRDEKLNKTLITRLINRLNEHGNKAETELQLQQQGSETQAASHQQRTLHHCNPEISEDHYEAEACGQPIPVIGGSVNHHFNSNVNNSYFSPLKQHQNPHQRPRRSVNDSRYSEEQKKELLSKQERLSMHLTEPIRSCIEDIIQTTGFGMKSMVLDDFTTSVVGAAFSKSEMLLREVYLFENIDTIFESTERLNHMKCIVILRPTKDNIELLCRELNRPHYRTYHICKLLSYLAITLLNHCHFTDDIISNYEDFTSRVGSTLIGKLSEADETEVVRCVKELPLDYLAITPFLFSLKLENRTFDLENDNWMTDGLKRSSDGLASVLIALQINPIIRYQTQSQQCRILAEKVSNIIKNESIANKTWRQAVPFDIKSLLIILDRRNDLITPVINKWIYYALIHEQFSIINNRIDLVDAPNRKPKDPKEMLISLENDQFFMENYSKNYGELGLVLKQAVENLKKQTQSQHKVETMEDMKRFIDEYPETRRYASNLHNHVFLMSELSRLVTESNLLTISECEQELVCGLISHSEILKKIKQLVSDKTIRPIDALRLVSLYIVCHPDKSSCGDLVKLLKSRQDMDDHDIGFVKKLRKFSLSKPQNPLDETVHQVTRMIVQGVKGVDNVLTQYKPEMRRIIEELRKGNRLKESNFAFQGERYRDGPPNRLIVFVIGGVTYDEALMADQINQSPDSNLQVIVGGTSIHNFRSFMDEVSRSIAK